MRLVLVLEILMMGQVVFASTAPTVTEVNASPRMDGSGVVDIYYTLSDADNDKCSITVIVSSDGGNTWTITPSASALSGDLSNVSPGGRHIAWASKTDLPGTFGSNYKIKVTANDSQVPSGMIWVYINNDPGVSEHEGFNGYMSKYETTNAQYAQYLISAKASGAITISGNYVVGTSGSYSGQKYYNLAGSGYTYTGVTNGGAARINWTGSSFTVDIGFENHPVTYVSWYGATAFASHYGWRLPTEWEWQAVADYDGSFFYGCGTSIHGKANYWIINHADGTTPVGAFGTYGYGMCDMAGNVWEWTSSCYNSDCSDSSPRVYRGGGWNSGSSGCEVSYRDSSGPDRMGVFDGFRVCR